MGTRFTPSFTNLYIADWESKLTWANGELDGSLVLWKRFIDDIVFVRKIFGVKNPCHLHYPKYKHTSSGTLVYE